METILKAKKIQFQALDVATDEKARMLWGRRAGKRKLPGLVRQGMIIGDVEEVEEWNEYGELMDHINEGRRGEEPPTMMSAGNTPSKAPPMETANPAMKEPAPTPANGKEVEVPEDEQLPSTPSKSSRQTEEKHLTTAMQSIGFEAAQKAKAAKSSKLKSSMEASDNALPTEAADTPSSNVPETVGIDATPKNNDPSMTPMEGGQGTDIPPEVAAAAEKAMARSAGEAVSEAAPVEESSIEDNPSKKDEISSIAQTTQDDGAATEIAKVATAADEAEVPEGRTRTQEQPAAKGDMAGESVGD